MRLAIFDLDGTVLRGNSWHEYFRWALRRWPSFAPLLLTRLAVRYARLTTPRQLRDAALRPLVGLDHAAVAAIGRELFEARLSSRIRAAARREIARARADQCEPVLATGAFDFVVEPIATELDVAEIVCSRIAFDGGKCLGWIDGEETRGLRKAEALREHFAGRIVDWAGSRAYSDDLEDTPMLLLVGEPVLVSTAVPAEAAGVKDLMHTPWADE